MTPASKEEPQVLWMAGKPADSPRNLTCLLFIAGAVLCIVFTLPRLTFHDVRPNEVSVSHLAVDANGPIATAIKLYKIDVGHYPNSLSELATPGPVGKGPYLEDASKFSDSWGNPLLYRVPGVHNRGSYDLWSAGPDNIDGTDDDIANWKR